MRFDPTTCGSDPTARGVPAYVGRVGTPGGVVPTNLSIIPQYRPFRA